MAGIFFTAVLVSRLLAGSLRAEERILIQGLADAELWNTDGDSDPFLRNEGSTAPIGRLRVWMAGDFSQSLQGFALGYGEGGDGTVDGETDYELQQAYLRYSTPTSRPLILQAGRLLLPYGSFSRRYLSSDNPLIGRPLNYQVSYPLGVQLNGALSRFDFMAAVLDGPLTSPGYDSSSESSPRPALGAGVTPLTGLRIGAYFTRGDYLPHIAETWLLPGKRLSDFDEKVVGGEVQYSRGHFELNGEITQSRLEVPAAGEARGRVWYLEPKVTISPRWYVAARWERGDLAEAEWIWAAQWEASTRRVHDLEAAAGFRVGPHLLAKASYRVAIGPAGSSLDGDARALAFQISYAFDVGSWFDRPR